MIYVGRFNESEIKEGIDKIKTKEAMNNHNLRYTNTKLIKKAGKIVAMDIWVCDKDEFAL